MLTMEVWQFSIDIYTTYVDTWYSTIAMRCVVPTVILLPVCRLKCRLLMKYFIKCLTIWFDSVISLSIVFTMFCAYCMDVCVHVYVLVSVLWWKVLLYSFIIIVTQTLRGNCWIGIEVSAWCHWQSGQSHLMNGWPALHPCIHTTSGYCAVVISSYD